MPKSSLIYGDAQLEQDLIETLLAGLKECRPDLNYPESHSDMQGCVRAIMRMYDIKRLPIAKPLKIKCDYCEGIGKFVTRIDINETSEVKCDDCKGKGYTEEY